MIITREVNGKNYKNDYRAILSWVVDKAKEKNKSKTGGIDDFKELMKEAKLADEQAGNNQSNNTTSW